MSETMTNFAYLVGSVLFILGIKGLTHPRTAVRGNLMSAVGMLIAIAVTVPELTGNGLKIVIAGLITGGVIGTILAQRVAMTAMPQMVAIFNGLGGAASALVGAATLLVNEHTPDMGLQELIATAATGLIGTVTFTGSIIAFAKLQEYKAFRNPYALPAQQAFNAIMLLAAVALSVGVVVDPFNLNYYWALCIVAAILGVTLVNPIGGADMPVVIALLNSYSGIAAAAAGFILNNTMLIVAGSLVGASGIILTQIMCKAMNRSLTNVLFGKMGDAGVKLSDDEVYGGKVKATSAAEIAMFLEDAQRVVIVPGYGMAVAQAQHAVRDFYNLLTERGCNVEFAIHPVAGRMPGHMNVLLAEVDIPYDKLLEMDTINPTLETVDVAIVLGANDVVNPDARKPDSAIAGMPIIDIDKCRTVINIKRSLSPGFAGIPNPLFALDNSLMFFADGKKAMQEIVAEIKAL